MAFLRKATFQTVDRWQVSPLCFYLEYKLKASYVYKHHFIEDLIHYNAPPHAKSWLTGKDPDAGRDWGQEEKGTTQDEMAGWHHWLDGRESEWTLGVGDGQGGLACCNSWGRRVGHNWETELKWIYYSSWHSLNIVPYIIHFSFLLIITQWEKWIILSPFFG